MWLRDVPGVISAAELERTVQSIVDWQLPSGMIPWFPGGHADPWNHTEAAMALLIGGRRAPRGAGLRMARPPPAARWRLAPLRGRRQGDRGQARCQRVRLPGDRVVVPLAALPRPQLSRRPLPDDRAGDRLRPRSSGAPGRDPLGTTQRRHPVAVRAADRVVVDLAVAAVRGGAGRCRRAGAARLGAVRRATGSDDPRPRRGPRARGVRAETALGDGLVLPGAGRLALPAAQANASPRTGTVSCCATSRARSGRALRRRTSRGSPQRKPASARSRTCGWATGRGRWSFSPRPPRLREAETGHYFTGRVYPDGVWFPDGERSTYTGAAVVLCADALTGASPASRVVHRRRRAARAAHRHRRRTRRVVRTPRDKVRYGSTSLPEGQLSRTKRRDDCVASARCALEHLTERGPLCS